MAIWPRPARKNCRAGPNTLVYVTDKVENVTSRVLKDITPAMSGKVRSEAVDKNIKGADRRMRER